MTNTNETQLKEDWFSLWEVGKELGIPYTPENIPLLEEVVDGWTTRAHSKPALAAKGHKEYYGSIQGKLTKKQEKKRSVSASKETDVTAEEFGQICDMIDKEPCTPAIPGRFHVFLIN